MRLEAYRRVAEAPSLEASERRPDGAHRPVRAAAPSGRDPAHRRRSADRDRAARRPNRLVPGRARAPGAVRARGVRAGPRPATGSPARSSSLRPTRWSFRCRVTRKTWPRGCSMHAAISSAHDPTAPPAFVRAARRGGKRVRPVPDHRCRGGERRDRHARRARPSGGERVRQPAVPGRDQSRRRGSAFADRAPGDRAADPGRADPPGREAPQGQRDARADRVAPSGDRRRAARRDPARDQGVGKRRCAS